jgi:rubrerythrin
MSERDNQLQRVSARMLRRRASAGIPDGSAPLWSASRFGLQRVKAYVQASAQQQSAVLATCAMGLIAESRFVERAGMEFCARMTLASENVAERQLFSLIAADEASHYAWLQPWAGAESTTLDPFNAFLADCVANATPEPLAYLMQIVLEGLGIVHYAGLASTCNDAALSKTLQRMAEDEALHHAAGLAAFSASRLADSERRWLINAAYTLLNMIRSGPQSVLAALDRELGGIARTDIPSIVAALDGAAETLSKLERIRQLMAQPGMEWLVDDLDARTAFLPCGASEVAEIYLSH